HDFPLVIDSVSSAPKVTVEHAQVSHGTVAEQVGMGWGHPSRGGRPCDLPSVVYATARIAERTTKGAEVSEAVTPPLVGIRSGAGGGSRKGDYESGDAQPGKETISKRADAHRLHFR